MDAVTAFLQGDLPEDGNLKEMGLTLPKVDPCVYFKLEGGKILMIAVYVDDFIIFSNDKDVKAWIKMELMKRFKMLDLGEAVYCLGLRITRDHKKGLISIDQQQYIHEVLQNFNMMDCNPVLTPFDPNQRITNDMCPKNDTERNEMIGVPYHEAVWSILFVAQVSRPDLSFAVSNVSRYNMNPGKPHWYAVKRILRYLKGTSDLKLTYSREKHTGILGYCDADWAADVDERRSNTGYVFMNQGAAVSWNSKRQPTSCLANRRGGVHVIVFGFPGSDVDKWTSEGII